VEGEGRLWTFLLEGTMWQRVVKVGIALSTGSPVTGEKMDFSDETYMIEIANMVTDN